MSSCGWLRHCPGGVVGVTAMRRRKSVHRSAKLASRHCFGAFVYTVALWAWVVGGLGIAIVYTNGRIGPLDAVLGHLCTLLRLARIVRATVGTRKSVHRSAKLASRIRFEALVYTVATRALRCELRRVVRAPQPPWRAGGAPLLVASPLVGKTGSARVAPPLGWHLRQGSNPHKSPMGLGAQGYTKDERAVHRAKAPSLWICSPDGPVTLLPFKVGRDQPDSGVESR